MTDPRHPKGVCKALAIAVALLATGLLAGCGGQSESAHLTAALKAGGRLAMSDILFGPRAHETFPSLFVENHVPALADYERSLREIGFSYVRLEDSTEFATDRLFERITKRYEQNPEDEYARNDYAFMQEFIKVEPRCCMVYAMK